MLQEFVSSVSDIMLRPKSVGQTPTYIFIYFLFLTCLIGSHGESNPGLLDATQVLYCKSRSRYYICCNGCAHMLQAFIPNVLAVFSHVCCKYVYLNVAYVSYICCKCFVWMLYMFYMVFKYFFSVFLQVF